MGTKRENACLDRSSILFTDRSDIKRVDAVPRGVNWNKEREDLILSPGSAKCILELQSKSSFREIFLFSIQSFSSKTI